MKKVSISAYYRRITEVLPEQCLKFLKRGWKYLSSLKKQYAQFTLTVLILLSFALLWQLYALSNRYYQATIEKAYAAKRLVYWNSIIEKLPNSPDAYFQAAAYSYALGEGVQARAYLDRALYLDPEFKEAMELRKKL